MLKGKCIFGGGKKLQISIAPANLNFNGHSDV